MMRRAALFLVVVGTVGCHCSRVTSVRNATDVAGVYVWRRANVDDSSNQITLSTDGGYCHRYIMDGGIGSECGTWDFSLVDSVSVVGLSDFRSDQQSDRLTGNWRGFEIERLGGKRRLVIDSDMGLYFVQFDGGSI